MSFPDFLCVGAQKAGTSWLHHNLGLQRHVWVPPIKELHYFGRGRRDSIVSRFTGGRPSYRKALRMAAGGVLRFPTRSRREALSWAVRFVALPRSLDRYASLFPDDEGLIKGELTPNYAVLREDEIAPIVARNPKLKVIYILRDPVDRAWSAVFMKQEKGRIDTGADASEAALLRSLEAAAILRHSDYVGNLERWRTFVSDEDLHVGFFEDLVGDPSAFLTRICAFLGIRGEEVRIPGDVARPRNARDHGGIPPDLLPVLAKAMLPLIREQDHHFANEHTARWLERAERLLASTGGFA